MNKRFFLNKKLSKGDNEVMWIMGVGCLWIFVQHEIQLHFPFVMSGVLCLLLLIVRYILTSQKGEVTTAGKFISLFIMLTQSFVMIYIHSQEKPPSYWITIPLSCIIAIVCTMALKWFSKK